MKEKQNNDILNDLCGFIEKSGNEPILNDGIVKYSDDEKIAYERKTDIAFQLEEGTLLLKLETEARGGVASNSLQKAIDDIYSSSVEKNRELLSILENSKDTFEELNILTTEAKVAKIESAFQSIIPFFKVKLNYYKMLDEAMISIRLSYHFLETEGIDQKQFDKIEKIVEKGKGYLQMICLLLDAM